MPRRLLRLFFLGCTAVSAFASAPESPVWPVVERDAKPWTRWWWLGDIADSKSITAEMESYAAAGLGGLELTPIYGVRGYEDRFVPFLSPAWIKNFEHVLAEGQRLGLGIDLANGTGWPFGGPWLSDTDVAHYLAHRIFTVDPGARLRDAVTLTATPVLRFAGPKQVPLSALRQPLAANPDLQDLAIDQVRFPNLMPLVSLMAYPEKGSPVDLTSRVDGSGHLGWTAPGDAGRWTLYALFQGQHGKLVERAAPGAEGYALDHLSSKALKNYLAKFDDAFRGHDLHGLRGFFNDSYEVDDSQGESDFTPDFFNAFQQRRGYDLRAHLPELFSPSAGEAGARVLSDYRETVSDLLRDEFTRPWQQWAAGHGALVRNQAHGSPALLLDLYAASDIPEQEGSDLLAIKLASSAAHLTGKRLASAETGTWLDEHFLSTLGELKGAVDTFLLGGINHNCYHGTAFSPLGDPWPGFQFYASVELNPRNPFWNDFALVNAYVARAQAFLQSGEPDEDVLLYYNIHDRWAVRGNGLLPHFHGGERDGVGARETAVELRAAGLGFDYISDRLLQNVSVATDHAASPTEPGTSTLRSTNASYRAVVVPPTHYMPVETLAHLVALAENGATVIILKALPESAPGLDAHATEYAQLHSRIDAHATRHDGITTARMGHGQFLIGDNLRALLARHSSLRGEHLGIPGVDYVRRRYDDGWFYFIVNRSEHAIDGWVPLRVPAASAALFEPMTGQSGRAAFHPAQAPTASSQVYLQLAPGASIIVQLHTREHAGRPWNYWQPEPGDRQPLTGEWSVRFDQGGPTLPPAAKVTTLESWTRFAGELGKIFSGTATYTLVFPRPSQKADAWTLDLGQVGDSARVLLNGREVAGLVQAPWTVVIPDDAMIDQNRLEVRVTNLAANRIADLDRRGVPWKKFYNVNMPARRHENTGPDKLFSAAHWSPRDSGLLGPVTLTPLHTFQP